MKYLAFIIFFTVVGSCGNTAKKQNQANIQTLKTAKPVQVSTSKEGYEKAYFASGCFWCVEAIYESVKGVKKAISGYSGGTGKNPNYQNYGRKGHAEAVEIIYDPELITYDQLLDVYFGSQNVTQQNGQGPDHGSSYRSIIFYQNAAQKKQIEAKISEVGKKYDQPVAAEMMPFQKFWKAEDYHQNYEKHHKDNPYVQNVSIPRLNRFKQKFPQLLKNNE